MDFTHLHQSTNVLYRGHLEVSGLGFSCWFQTLCPWFLVPGAWFSCSRFLSYGNKKQVSSFLFFWGRGLSLVPGSWSFVLLFQVPGFLVHGFEVPVFIFWSSCTWSLVFWFPVSGLWLSFPLFLVPWFLVPNFLVVDSWFVASGSWFSCSWFLVQLMLRFQGLEGCRETSRPPDLCVEEATYL